MTTMDDQQELLRRIASLEAQGVLRRDPTCRRWTWAFSGKTALTDWDIARGFFNLGRRA